MEFNDAVTYIMQLIREKGFICTLDVYEPLTGNTNNKTAIIKVYANEDDRERDWELVVLTLYSDGRCYWRLSRFYGILSFSERMKVKDCLDEIRLTWLKEGGKIGV